MFDEMTKIDSEIRTQLSERMTNDYHTIDDLPLTSAQKERVLEWFARKIATVMGKVTGYHPCSKSYDPLMIEDNIAHSYAFELEDGGRHHDFNDLKHLEKMMVNELITEMKRHAAEGTNEC
jgi:hypothetical protein